MQISLSEQIRCVEREISMRKRVYPGLVIRGKMTEGQKDREIGDEENAIEFDITGIVAVNGDIIAMGVSPARVKTIIEALYENS